MSRPPSKPSSIFNEGDVLDEFVLRRFVGQGGQAEIWEVAYRDYPHRGPLALKLRYILFNQRDDHDFQQGEKRLVQEQNLLGKIRSRYIVSPLKRLDGPFEVGEQTYKIAGLVMDLASERSLHEFLDSDHYSRFSPLQKIELLKQLADGLHAIQFEKIVHNDIKPHNILVTHEPSGFVCRYADFGFAYRLGETVVQGGTRGYMAPELEAKTHGPSFETDMYSLAVVFYQALTGIHPANSVGSSPPLNQVLAGHLSTHEYFDVASLEPTYSRNLTRLIEQMGSRDQEARPTIDEVQEALSQAIAAARLELITHSSEIVPELAGRFRWAADLHAVFNEKEYLAFLKVDQADLDAASIAKALESEKIYGFAIFRLLGSNDYLVRVWCDDANKPRLERALNGYRARPGAQSQVQMFRPVYRWPQLFGRRKRPEKQAEVLAFLESLTDPETGPRQVAAARAGGLIVGTSKTIREAAPAEPRVSTIEGSRSRRRFDRKHAIRAICYARALTELPAEVADAIAERIHREVSRMDGVAELEVLGSPGGGGVQTEFVLVLELDQFHTYRYVLATVAKIVTSFGQSIAEFRSNFEMDPVPAFEAYDGQLLYALQRRRQRERRFD